MAKAAGIIVLCLLSGVFDCARVDASPGKMLKATEIRLSANTYGLNIVLIREDGIKWMVPSQKFYFAAYAPDWQLIRYNWQSHYGKLEDYYDWKTSFVPRRKINITAVKASPGVFQGIPVRNVLMQVKPAESFSGSTEFVYQGAADRSRQFTSMELVETSALKLTAEQLHFIRCMVNNNKVEGVLLSQDNIYPTGPREKLIRTAAIKEVQIPQAEWRYPESFINATPAQVTNENQRCRDAAVMMGTFILDQAPEASATAPGVEKRPYNVMFKTSVELARHHRH